MYVSRLEYIYDFSKALIYMVLQCLSLVLLPWFYLQVVGQSEVFVFSKEVVKPNFFAMFRNELKKSMHKIRWLITAYDSWGEDSFKTIWDGCMD